MSNNNKEQKRTGRIGGEGTHSKGAGISQSRSNRIATLSSMRSDEESAQALHNDESDEEVEEKEGESWFAGGERSGISVQNPRLPVPGRSGHGPHLVHEILVRASQAAPATSEPLSFPGDGHTLGSDEVESTRIPAQKQAKTTQRKITFWRNGFSVEGGQFYSYSDPTNLQLLADIKSGTAPLEMLGVPSGDPVEVCVVDHTNEDYVAGSHSWTAFSGMGGRLGSPTPGFTTQTQNMPGSFQAPSQSARMRTEPDQIIPSLEVDQTLPTTTVQVRFADGSRQPFRMNYTHTVGDLRNLINAANPASSARPYTIATTFPTQILGNVEQTIKEANLINTVVAQQWA